MTKARFFLVCLVAMFAFLACTQPAAAQKKPRFHVKAVPSNHSDAKENVNPAPPANLYGLEAAFTATSFLFPPNSDTSFIWPCFGDGSGTGDCPFIGDPQQNFPAGGVAVGVPQYVWSFADCDGNTVSSTTPCGETETWYEDDSNDSAADLTYLVEVTQGTGAGLKIIADSGVVDFGANPFGGLVPPADVVFSGALNFGTLGVPTGPNNGNCDADFNYPLVSNANPGQVYVVQANKTCADPVPGLATITATTELAVPKYTKKTTALACAPVAAPCYTVTFTKKYSVIQKWNIWLQ
jgi:hypothetical protein